MGVNKGYSGDNTVYVRAEDDDGDKNAVNHFESDIRVFDIIVLVMSAGKWRIVKMIMYM
jgi:hypothetical protein